MLVINVKNFQLLQQWYCYSRSFWLANHIYWILFAFECVKCSTINFSYLKVQEIVVIFDILDISYLSPILWSLMLLVSINNN